jgi:hypothetical protein
MSSNERFWATLMRLRNAIGPPETRAIAPRSRFLRKTKTTDSAARRLALPIVRTLPNLEVHEKEFRSQSGDDSEDNLITLRAECHAGVHKAETNDRR